MKSVIYKEYLPSGMAITEDCYIEALMRLPKVINENGLDCCSKKLFHA